MKSKPFKLLFTLLLITAVFLAVGCRREEDKLPSLEDQVPPNDTQITDESTDVELTEDIRGEEEIIDGRVYEHEDYMIGTMIIEKGVGQAKIDELAQKYANQLKEKYPDKKVNVQAVQDGVNVANITLDEAD